MAKTEALALDSLRLLIKQYVSEFSPGRTFVHAGVVSVAGQGVMVPGRSMSGKTTLITALLRAGATYYSDEYAVIGNNGLVSPFPQPLGVRPPGRHAQRDMRPDEMGAAVGSVPVRLAMVVATRFAPGTAWAPRRLTPAETILAMLEHTPGAQRNPQRTLARLRAATAHAEGLGGDRGDAAAAAKWILARLRRAHPLQSSRARLRAPGRGPAGP